MTHEQKIQFIQERCIKANPEKGWWSAAEGLREYEFRLADVLLAIKEKQGTSSTFFVNPYGLFYSFEGTDFKSGSTATVKYLHLGWNLLKDDLSQQSEETVSFIYELLK